ncbi:glycosyltransferase [Blastococcus sp. HT6-30]|uniref:glycosyltransferase family 2 protein n=1 Tax=Blastococcus sp. HT6-30 TaxID=3144843 RepID=UPI00321930E5
MDRRALPGAGALRRRRPGAVRDDDLERRAGDRAPAPARPGSRRYVSRPEHDHAKAGNLNHALALVRTDLVAVLDADHVPDPDFLSRTVPYFADERLALVQTPQHFYNTSSFEHLRPGVDLHEESLFYRVIQAGKHHAGAAFWCGTNAVLRVGALREVGGVATESLTEDLHTTMKLHRAGWRSTYHNEVLARGLAAGSPDAFYAQRRRWAGVRCRYCGTTTRSPPRG